MNISILKFNLLATISTAICTTLLLITSAQAGELLSSTPNSTPKFSQPNTTVIALRKKKRIQKKVKQKAKKTAIVTPATPAADITQAPPAPIPSDPTESTPPVAPPAPPIAPTEPAQPPVPASPPAALPSPFSLTTKLEGQIIFGATGVISGDFNRNVAAGYRARLELKTAIGDGTLTTRLQADNLGSATAATTEGRLSWTGDAAGTVGIDALKYEFPLSAQTKMVVAANAGAADDFTDTINPYFDGDGASGSISAFGNRPSIYYTVQGAGAGIRHQLSDSTELSLGYLARNANQPTVGNGLFAGGYGALAQISFKTGENSKVGLTYTRSFNSDPGTGSTNANLGGSSNNFGLQGSFQLNPQFVLGGWAGYTQNQAAGIDRQIWTWAVTAAAPDLGGKGNLAGILVGQEPRVTFASDGTADTKAGLHLEAFYQFKVNDNVSITPGFIYLTAPNQDVNNNGAVIGGLRTTFTF